MRHTSKKHRDKKIRNIVIIGLLALLIVSYFISRKHKTIDPEVIANVHVQEPSAHIRGNLNSEIHLIEYSDFQCPACAAAEPQIDSLLEQYGNKFKLEFRNFPLKPIHPNAQLGAQAAEAAGMQGKYWEMHDLLFERQKEWSKSRTPKKIFKKYAEEIGINVDRFTFDMNSKDIKNLVNTQYSEAMSLGLPGTPSFVFNGERVDINDFIKKYLIDGVDTTSIKELE